MRRRSSMEVLHSWLAATDILLNFKPLDEGARSPHDPLPFLQNYDTQLTYTSQQQNWRLRTGADSVQRKVVVSNGKEPSTHAPCQRRSRRQGFAGPRPVRRGSVSS